MKTIGKRLNRVAPQSRKKTALFLSPLSHRDTLSNGRQCAWAPTPIVPRCGPLVIIQSLDHPVALNLISCGARTSEREKHILDGETENSPSYVTQSGRRASFSRYTQAANAPAVLYSNKASPTYFNLQWRGTDASEDFLVGRMLLGNFLENYGLSASRRLIKKEKSFVFFFLFEI